LQSKTFILRYTAWVDGVTKVFVPDFQYPEGYTWDIQGGEVARAKEKQTIEIHALSSGIISLKIVPKG
jgi:hypothetical protein